METNKINFFFPYTIPLDVILTLPRRFLDLGTQGISFLWGCFELRTSVHASKQFLGTTVFASRGIP